MVAQEATSGKVKIEEQNPEAIQVILKYIYGGGQYPNYCKSRALINFCEAAAVNMTEETRNRPVVRFCVDLYRAADYFLLPLMFPIIQRRLEDHCDEKLKWLCTRGNTQFNETNRTTLRWTMDLVDGIKQAYKWNTEGIKKTLMEFVWVGRKRFLGTGWVSIQDRLDDTPAFIKDMLRHCAMLPWQLDSAWAPNFQDVPVSQRGRCVRCGKDLAICRSGNSDADGQVWDPFTISGDNRTRREWCKECAAMDMIPWR